MNLVIRHLFRDLGDFYVTNFFQTLYNKIQLRFPEHSFDIQNDSSYEDNGYGSIYSCMHLSILNPNNQKYLVVSFFDNWRYLFMKHLGWSPQLMTQMFYCGGFNYLEYFYWKKYNQNNSDVYLPLDIEHKYYSFFYGPYNINHENIETELYDSRKIQDTIPNLYFRGYLWDFRRGLVDGLDIPDSLILDKNLEDNNLNYNEYLRDLSQYRAALSLPGGTEMCNRDIECFSIGVPVIRPLLTVNYPDPLLPNYHYIPCYDTYKYYEGYPVVLNSKAFQESLNDCWNRVKYNEEYLNFISNNARKWYTKNCTLSCNTDYVLSTINLEMLYG